MIRCIAFGIFLFCCFHLTSSVFSQSIESDSVFLQKSIRQAYLQYEQSLSTQSHLYNGSEYVDYDNFIQGHQYFESDDWEDGSILYDGVLYHNVPLRYDLVLDKVVTENFAGPLQIQLVSEKIKHFTLLDHTFIRLVNDTASSNAVRTGFYDQLYTGQTKVLAKRTKLIDEQIKSGRVEKKFSQRNRYFIQKVKQYYPVKRKGSVLDVFNDRKKELQKYLRDNKIRFRKNRESAMVKMAQYYDALSASQ